MENNNKKNLNDQSNSTHYHSHNYISQKHNSHKIKKKTGNACYCLNLLEQYGSINIIIPLNNYKIYISKMKLIQFNDHFDELLEKGQKIKNENDENYSSIPDKTFYYQRYYYYSKYDEGIKMDYESWWSVTPEIIAEYTSKLIENYSVIDGFCGSGGNVIQFSKYCKKVFAIDIDDKKLDICKNNCKVYNCKNNISFIHCDFLQIDKYEKEKVFADFIFLSPPWGGIQYKNSDVYSIKNLMTPNIYDIVKMSLKVSKHIMFYVPRTLLLEELFDILSEINKSDRIFFDVHILKSANKIKALLIIFGYDINCKIEEKDISDYLKCMYEPFNISDRNIEILCAMSKIIGNFKFFHNEIEFRKDLLSEGNDCESDVGFSLVKYFFNKILTDQEKIKLKSLNIFNPKLIHRKKSSHSNKNSNNIIHNSINYIYNNNNNNIKGKEKTIIKPLNQIIISNNSFNVPSSPSISTNSSTGSNISSNIKHLWILEEINEISFQFLSTSM